MRSKKEGEEQLTSCPYCGASLKEKNLSKHVSKLHARRTMKDARSKARVSVKYSVKGGRKKKLFVLGVLLLIVLAISTYAFINTRSDVASSSVGGVTVKLLYPDGGETLSGVVNIRWSASGSNELKIKIQYSTDPPPFCPLCPRQKWHDLATNLENNGVFEWDTTQFPDGRYTLKVIASDGTNTAEYICDGQPYCGGAVFTIKN